MNLLGMMDVHRKHFNNTVKKLSYWYFSSSASLTSNINVPPSVYFLDEFNLVNHKGSDKLQKFIERVSIFEKQDSLRCRKLTTAKLISTNSKLVSINQGFRTKKAIVDTGDFMFVSDCQTKVESQIEEYISLFNDSRYSSLEYAIYLYFKFLYIHPFPDGNGRLARLLFMKAIGNDCLFLYCPFLYLKKKSKKKFLNCVINSGESFQKFKSESELNFFIRKGKRKSKKFNGALNTFYSSLNLDKESEKFYRKFIRQPILVLEQEDFEQAHLYKKFASDNLVTFYNQRKANSNQMIAVSFPILTLLEQLHNIIVKEN